MKLKLTGTVIALALTAVVLMLTLCSCGDESGSGDGGNNSGDSGSANSGEMVAFPADKATATITGKVVLDGKMPKQTFLRIQGDEFCTECHPDKVPNPKKLVNEDNTVPNCFVYVKKGADNWEFDTPTEKVLVHQTGCMYDPHVFGVMANQVVDITSNDDTTHNVHIFSEEKGEDNFTQKKGQHNELKYPRQEVMVKLKCDVHGWMTSYMGVLYHPFFSVTSETGEFTLPKLPAGNYTLEIWHEHFGTTTVDVELGDGKTETLEIKLSAK